MRNKVLPNVGSIKIERLPQIIKKPLTQLVQFRPKRSNNHQTSTKYHKNFHLFFEIKMLIY